MKSKNQQSIFHSDALLRSQKLLLEQRPSGKMRLIDWDTFKPVDRDRELAFLMATDEALEPEVIAAQKEARSRLVAEHKLEPAGLLCDAKSTLVATHEGKSVEILCNDCVHRLAELEQAALQA